MNKKPLNNFVYTELDSQYYESLESILEDIEKALEISSFFKEYHSQAQFKVLKLKLLDSISRGFKMYKGDE